MKKTELDAVEELFDAMHFVLEMSSKKIPELGTFPDTGQFMVTFKVPSRWADDCSHPGEIITRVVEYEVKEFFNMHSAIAFLCYREMCLRHP